MARHWVKILVIHTWTLILVHLGIQVPQRSLRIKVVLILLPVRPSVSSSSLPFSLFVILSDHGLTSRWISI